MLGGHTILGMTGRCVVLAVSLAATCSGCSETPTAPDQRRGSPTIVIRCDTATQFALECTAPVVCSLYPCPDGTPSDVTSTATWSVDDTSIARIAGQGKIVSVSPGYTVVRAVASFMSGSRSIAVFTGTVPLPTQGLAGAVYEGPNRAIGAINGATVEVIKGLIKGRTAISGLPPEPVAGWIAITPPAGIYIINGVPPGTIRLRVTKPEYVSREQDVTFTLTGGPPAVDFQLQRQ